jgi:undecaprenyl diphosphate synthase
MKSRRAPARLPRHVGFIPDGNRRWAKQMALPAAAGYEAGVAPGLALVDICRELGIEEISIYGFTQDNTRRPREQTAAFRHACVEFARGAVARDASLMVVGDDASPLFPEELRPYSGLRRRAGPPAINLLVNYGWQWDLRAALNAAAESGVVPPGVPTGLIASAGVSRIDLIVRWGGRRRLSGFLPIQAVYADFYVIDAWWPDFELHQFDEALSWYAMQDVTLGG